MRFFFISNLKVFNMSHLFCRISVLISLMLVGFIHAATNPDRSLPSVNMNAEMSSNQNTRISENINTTAVTQCLIDNSESSPKYIYYLERKMSQMYHITLGTCRAPNPMGEIEFARFIDEVRDRLEISSRKIDFFPVQNAYLALMVHNYENNVHKVYRDLDVRNITRDFDERKPVDKVDIVLILDSVRLSDWWGNAQNIHFPVNEAPCYREQSKHRFIPHITICSIMKYDKRKYLVSDNGKVNAHDGTDRIYYKPFTTLKEKKMLRDLFYQFHRENVGNVAGLLDKRFKISKLTLTTKGDDNIFSVVEPIRLGTPSRDNSFR